jgi:uncharacterized protein YraI
MRHLATAMICAALALALAPGAASAAGAYASNRISMFELPRYETNEIVGILQAGEPVTIDRCTASGRWCRVFAERYTGWVPADYLIGAAAKADATPLRSLTVPPFDDREDLSHTRRDGLF